ncbi:MAG TPA: DUF1499 domain-containing protein [Reyranella sp.]|nr:DUF1499 domain-containing protein [Reyranella sp.]
MLFRRTNPVSHRLARLAFYMACAAAVVVAVSGPLHRYLGVDIDLALTVFRYGFYLAAASVALALATIVPTRPGDRRRGFLAAVLALAVGVAAAWAPLTLLLRARQAPPISDVSTDTSNPPPLVITLQLRQESRQGGDGSYPIANAALQRAAYPDIGTISLALPPADAFKRVDAVAMALGWDVVARAPRDGRIEAIDTTTWFGLQDDVVVRIRPDGGGSKIDIRSKSRTGTSDLGANADRIRLFTEKLKALTN